MNKIVPCLWFNSQAEEAVQFYAATFKNTKIGKVTRYDEASAKESGQPVGSVLTIELQIEGQDFLALNGGPLFKFTEAISFIVNCKDQAEVDHFWNALTGNGGQEVQCGWLKDKYGVSWQVVPEALERCLSNPDPVKAQRAMKAMLQMKKIMRDLLQ